jgi:myo-inositol-1(or 4)-monophosphatase
LSLNKSESTSVSNILTRIEQALAAANTVVHSLIRNEVKVDYKQGDDPVTEVDRAVNRELNRILLRDDEGWLSEETADDPVRLEKRRVWIVDPIDGTREFVTGIPEWCISIGFVEDGQPIAGGISNPITGEIIIGSIETGVTYNGEPARVSPVASLSESVVLASRSETKRGEWEKFSSARFTVKPMGSVAYKLALVAAGRSDVTWTLVPKHEWDVAAGTALVRAAGGFVCGYPQASIEFNKREPLFSGLVAAPLALQDEIEKLLGISK